MGNKTKREGGMIMFSLLSVDIAKYNTRLGVCVRVGGELLQQGFLIISHLVGAMRSDFMLCHSHNKNMPYTHRW